MNGNDIIIMEGSGYDTQGGGTIIGAMKSCDMSIKYDTMETCNTSTDSYMIGWRTFTRGRKEWSITSNHLISTVTAPLLRAGQTYSLQIRSRDNTRDAIYGRAICTEATITATRGNLATGSFKFKGTGGLRTLMS